MIVPRTQEFSGMQQQAAQRPLSEQNILANRSSKETEELRSQNTAVEQSAKAQVHADQEGSQGSKYYKAVRKRKSDQPGEDETSSEPPVHPFKGHHLDIKL